MRIEIFIYLCIDSIYLFSVNLLFIITKLYLKSSEILKF